MLPYGEALNWDLFYLIGFSFGDGVNAVLALLATFLTVASWQQQDTTWKNLPYKNKAVSILLGLWFFSSGVDYACRILSMFTNLHYILLGTSILSAVVALMNVVVWVSWRRELLDGSLNQKAYEAMGAVTETQAVEAVRIISFLEAKEDLALSCWHYSAEEDVNERPGEALTCFWHTQGWANMMGRPEGVIGERHEDLMPNNRQDPIIAERWADFDAGVYAALKSGMMWDRQLQYWPGTSASPPAWINSRCGPLYERGEISGVWILTEDVSTLVARLTVQKEDDDE